MTDLGAPLSSGIIAAFELVGMDAQTIVTSFNPVPQLQPFGDKPVKSFSLQPVQYLLTHRSELQTVRESTEGMLRPLVNAERVAGITEEKFFVYDVPHKQAYIDVDGFRAHQTDLRTAIDRLNRLYVRAMEGTLAVLSDEEIDTLMELSCPLLGYLGVFPVYVRRLREGMSTFLWQRHSHPDDPRIDPRDRERMCEWVYRGVPDEMQQPMREMLRTRQRKDESFHDACRKLDDLCVAYAVANQSYEAKRENREWDEKMQLALDGKLTAAEWNAFQNRPREIPWGFELDRFQQASRRWWTFMRGILMVSYALRELPLLVPTGATEPDLRPEPEDNARARLARELVSFEQRFGGNVGYCYIKLPTGEQTIRTLLPPALILTTAQQEQVAKIRQQRHIPEQPPAQPAAAGQFDHRAGQQPRSTPQAPGQPQPPEFRRKPRSTDTRTIPGKEEQ